MEIDPLLQKEVEHLITVVPRQPESRLVQKASKAKLAAFSAKNGVVIPEELEEWLIRHDGVLAGPGGIYGITTDNAMVNIQAVLDRHPEWKERGWIPVAGDGCGNDYVLDTKLTVGTTHPIYFVDNWADPDEAVYVVASGLWRFLLFLLRRELSKQYPDYAQWPFHSAYVLREDPMLSRYIGLFPMPWR